ncbi:cupin domain-containing protein [Streptomyces sp. H39-S7]|uniref:cupin domain-containing protein n=1 Tax=Streptomyces sp. H39-S7 TaxID=3004357 RepID=UPI0022AE5E38|nr:cupin domain-containing protein [Streptomyces sp. H39-S7]MCZ4122219.1 cupin domain-containing protein [Streptomyces sp. H39-S7]
MTMPETALPPVVNIAAALGRFSEQWAQRRIAGVNDYDVKVAKLEGEFVWHSHEDTDELLLVVSGRLTVRFRAGDVFLDPGEFVVVPRGVEHCTAAEEETAILLLEPAGVVNTGDAGGAMTKAARELEG